MLTPKLIPMEKMEQLEKARTAGEAAAAMNPPPSTKGTAGAASAKLEQKPVLSQMEKAGPTKGFGSKRGSDSSHRRTSTQSEGIRGGGSATKTVDSHRSGGRREGFDTDFYNRTKVINRPDRKPPTAQDRADTAAAAKKIGLEVAGMQKQRLDDAAVQLEKIFGFRDRKKKDPSKTEAQEQRALGTWDTKWRERDADKKRVARERQQVKDVATAPGRAAKEGTKRAGSLLSRAFGAGKRKAQDVAGAPGRRQERKASERHQSNLRDKATADRVKASNERRDARQQSPKTPQEGRTGYTNGHDTGLGGKTDERSAAIPKHRAKTKVQQADSDRGAAAARAKADSYKSPRERAPQPQVGVRGVQETFTPKPRTQGTKPPIQPKQEAPKVDPTKPVWGQNMEKAVITLQKYLDDCGCD